MRKIQVQVTQAHINAAIDAHLHPLHFALRQLGVPVRMVGIDAVMFEDGTEFELQWYARIWCRERDRAPMWAQPFTFEIEVPG